MSHEIRTPLNGVIGFAQIGQRLPRGAPGVEDAFARIVSAGRLLQGILNDVLDMSKMEAGKLSLHLEPISLGTVASRAVELIQESARQKNVSIHHVISQDFPEWVTGDSQRVEQVLLNLLSNAVKFTEVGRVELSLDNCDGNVCFRITDSGIGMSPDQLKQLFLPFEQGDNSITRRYGGAGLGLVITKRLVELMGGTISVASEPHSGSIFTVVLPMGVVPPDTSEKLQAKRASDFLLGNEAPPGTSTQRLSGLRLLVVEDNEVNQLVIEGMLKFEGAVVEVVSDGYQAVDRIGMSDSEPIDAVLLDVMMPGIDGYETARRMKATKPDVPIIGQTAHALPEDLGHCLSAGMVDRITKPIVVEELIQVLMRNVRQFERPGEQP